MHNLKTISLFILLFIISSCNKGEQALKVDALEQEVQTLLSKMTLEEKIGQLNLRGTSSRVKGSLPEELKQAVREGKIGAFLNVMNIEYVDELQKIAIEESPNKIPLIFSRDVIHGFKTIFPIPLGLAASWDVNIAENSSRVAAIEASTFGVRWTFAPMLDIARDSRWGRIAESPGEDPFLASLLAKAYVKGFQGDSLNDPTSMIACAKHFVGYGAAIGGRDYNTAIINKELLQNVYLPPFEAAFDEGAQTVMTAFNEVNGIPASGDEYMLDDVLRKQFSFDGFVVSDWNSVTEMIPHGFAKNEKHAAQLALNAGLNMEMTSKSYENNVKELIKEGKISEKKINSLVADILRVKFRMGLFKNPLRVDNDKIIYAKNHLKLAQEAVIKSSVLLKNKASILPLEKSKNIAVIGPLADKPREQLGTWTFDGDKEYTVTPVSSFSKEKIKYSFTEGLTYSRDSLTVGFKKAINNAKKSDVIVFIGGEEAILSGEAHSRADTKLPGIQERLIKELAKTGKPIVLIIMAGRPISLQNIIDDVDAVLMTWHPGTMGGPAIYDMLFGVQEPEGRLPVTWVKTSGQSPLFYNHKNTGRPAVKEKFVHMRNIPIGAWQSSLGNTSHYLDAGYTPHYPFGYGLGYTTFEYSDLKLSSNTISKTENITIKVTLKNTGSRAGSDIVQLYVQDVVGSITRPVKELKSFQKVHLTPGETKEISFELAIENLKYYNNNLEFDVEKGDFNVFVGRNSESVLKESFVYE